MHHRIVTGKQRYEYEMYEPSKPDPWNDFWNMQWNAANSFIVKVMLLSINLFDPPRGGFLF